ncbi:MAG: hypothetical protein ACK5MU_00750 [Candidatus Saccharimonadales bacterium]
MSNFSKSLLAHIKYPYTAAIIAVMWIGMAIILGLSGGANFEILLVSTAAVSLVIALIGFSSPKK